MKILLIILITISFFSMKLHASSECSGCEIESTPDIINDYIQNLRETISNISSNI